MQLLSLTTYANLAIVFSTQTYFFDHREAQIKTEFQCQLSLHVSLSLTTL